MFSPLPFPDKKDGECGHGNSDQQPDKSQELEEHEDRQDYEKWMQTDFAADNARREEHYFHHMEKPDCAEGKQHFWQDGGFAESRHNAGEYHDNNQPKIRHKVQDCCQQAEEKRILDVKD